MTDRANDPAPKAANQAANQAAARSAPSARGPMLSFRSGGWLLVAMLLLCTAIIAWAFAGVLSGSHPVGDGGDPATYGFDLERGDSDGRILVASGNPRDFLAPLDHPRIAAGRDIVEINRAERGKYLVSTDRVIGVELGGVSRAYPLRLLNAHEVCNDELAGVPIAVTYSPLCDSVLVFDRRVRLPDGVTRTLKFGVSGLLLDSNLLLYDRDEQAVGAAGSSLSPRSLWSQLLGRAITGPDSRAAGGLPLELRPISGVQLVPWVMWLERRPETTVALRDDASARRVKRIDYGRYWASGELRYPVGRPPDPSLLAQRGLTVMSPAVAVSVRTEGGSVTELFALPEISGSLPQEGPASWATEIGGLPVRLTFSADRRSAWVDASDALLVHGRWFALWERGDPEAGAKER
jgi:hypothetical protein